MTTETQPRQTMADRYRPPTTEEYRAETVRHLETTLGRIDEQITMLREREREIANEIAALLDHREGWQALLQETREA